MKTCEEMRGESEARGWGKIREGETRRANKGKFEEEKQGKGMKRKKAMKTDGEMKGGEDDEGR